MDFYVFYVLTKPGPNIKQIETMVFLCFIFGFVSKPRTGPPNPTIINLTTKIQPTKKHRALQPSELQSINATIRKTSSFSAEARELEDPTCTNSRMWSSSKGSTPIWCSPLPGGVKGCVGVLVEDEDGEEIQEIMFFLVGWELFCLKRKDGCEIFWNISFF